MFWNYFHNRFAKLVQKGTVDEVFQLLDSDYEFPEKAQKALILRKNEAEIRGYFIRKRTLSDANQVLLIEQMPSEIFDLIDHQSVCDKAAEMIVQQGNSDCIKLLLYQQQLSWNIQEDVIKRGNSDEIKSLLISQTDISTGVIEMIAERGRLDEVETLLNHHSIRSLGLLKDGVYNTLMEQKKQILMKRNTEIINMGNSQKIISMLKSLKDCHEAVLDEKSRDRIIFRNNPEEIKAYLDSGYVPTEKALLHLIESGSYELAARCLNMDLGGYSPITEKVIMAVLEKGDELLGTTLVHHQDQLLFQLKRMQKTQEWLENRVLERGYKNEISCLARIYKVSPHTIAEILRRNNKQEIKALLDSKNLDDAYIYDLIDQQRYDLLENYARCVPNNPTFYLLAKYMKAHR